ncbi:hypothetical protein CGCF415_v006770 [Colletotrichum fructicola]|nr:hypothetical protein CGCF415_v006770 [Colletotrichum fructicola]
MAVSRESAVIIERRPLDTSPAARLNSYNHHALAPWLEETGYLTPLFLHKRKKEIAPCNMGPWLSPAIRLHMLHPPVAVHRLSQTEVVALLEVASEVQHDVTKAESIDRLQSLACRINETMGGFGKNPPPPPPPPPRYFVRMGHCSPKDADAGTLRPVFTIKDALVKLVSSK